MSNATYPLYQRLPGLVLGFHGCDAKVGELLLSGKAEHLNESINTYDWLGRGIYFWENDPQRAMEFARAAAAKPKMSRGHIETPFVLGAVIDLSFCLNLLDRTALEEVAVAHETLKATHLTSKEPMPINKGENLGARFLDRAVIETLHVYRELLDEMGGGFPRYDSVRAVFREGDELYKGAGFRSQNHIQIAIRSKACIKGYFRPFSE